MEFPEFTCECTREHTITHGFGKKIKHFIEIIKCNWIGKRYVISTPVATLYLNACGMCISNIRVNKPHWSVIEIGTE